MEKSYQVLNAGTGFEDGINFFDEFNEEMVNQGLTALSILLPPSCKCYCLRIEEDLNGLGQFRPFGNVYSANGVIDRISPDVVPLNKLVVNEREWPLFRLGIGAPDAALIKQVRPETRKELEQVKWAVQIRLQNGERFVGYFKIVGCDRPLPERDLQIAFYHTKFHMLSMVSNQILERMSLSASFQRQLQTTLHAIVGIQREAQALRHIADMLSSHLGLGWNRVACLCPDEHDSLNVCGPRGATGRTVGARFRTESRRWHLLPI